MKEKLINLVLYHLLPAVVLIYVGFGVYMWYFQTNYIYFPSGQLFTQCISMLDAERINIDGTRAYYKKTDGPLVILYHGNAGSACDRAWYVNKYFDPLGLSYLIVEYGGYGEKIIEPSATGILKDAEHIASFVRDEEYNDVIIMSESIGSGPAAYHASLQTPEMMILTTPMLSLQQIAHEHYPIYPTSIILTEKLDVVEILKDVDASIHILHGTDDAVIPLRHAEALYESLTTFNKTLTVVEGAVHNDIYGTLKWEARVSSLLSSLNE